MSRLACSWELTGNGIPQVDFPGNPLGWVPRGTTLIVTEEAVGQEVTLMFEEGDPSTADRHRSATDTGSRQSRTPGRLHARVDGQTVTITAENEIVLRCGEATLMLTKDGKVNSICVPYLLSRSSGVNRIQGGSIELN